MADSTHGGEDRRRVSDFRLGKVEEEIKELRREFHEGIRQLQSDLANLHFVRIDNYERDQKATEKAIDAAKKEADQRVAEVEQASKDRDAETRHRADFAVRLVLTLFGLVASPLAGALIFWLANIK